MTVLDRLTYVLLALIVVMFAVLIWGAGPIHAGPMHAAPIDAAAL